MTGSRAGFTLIELMIVVAIIGILAAIAMPMYQSYTIRAQVSEGITLSTGAKTAITQYYVERGAWPADNTIAGIADKVQIVGKYTEHIAVQNNVIEVKFGNNAHAAIGGKTIKLTASDNSGSIGWICAGDGTIKTGYLPKACR
jgi:type IV pilus assembly protein PilA